MTTTNDFLPFATAGSAEVLTQAQYLALLRTTISNGFQTGIADPSTVNKVWRQSSIMASVVAQVICDLTGQNATDDGTTTTLTANLKSAISLLGNNYLANATALRTNGHSSNQAAANLLGFISEQDGLSATYVYNSSDTTSGAVINGTLVASTQTGPTFTLAQVAGGPVNGTFYVKVTYTSAAGECVSSSELNITISGGLLQVTITGTTPAFATGIKIYVSTAAGTETLQATLAIGTTAWTMPTTGLVTGVSAPTTTTYGSVLTVNSVTSGAVAVSDYLNGVSVTAGTLVVAGTTPTFLVTGQQTVSAELMTCDTRSILVAYDGSRWDILNTFLQQGTGAVARTVQSKLQEVVSVEDFGAVGDGVHDDTLAFNLAVQWAVNKMISVATDNEIWSITIKATGGQDYYLAGTVLFTSGIRFDLQGARLIGTSSTAGSSAYNLSGQIMFDTAYWNGTALVSNYNATNDTTWRIIGAGIENATFINCNIPMRLTNFQEQCRLDGIRFSNCSIMWISSGNYYSTFGKKQPIICRNSALAAGAPGIYLTGLSANDLYINANIIGAAIGIKVDSTNSIDVEVHGSLEGSYAINGIGILAAGSAYCQGWKVHSYVEGVYTGVATTGTSSVAGGQFYACDFTAMYFSSCYNSFLSNLDSFRNCQVDATSAADGGGTIRNLMNFSAPGNDVLVRLTVKTASTTGGPVAFPTNIMLSAGSQAVGSSIWYDNTDVTVPGTDLIAMCDGRTANVGQVGVFPFEGAQMVSKENQVPFCSLVVSINTLTVNTSLRFDSSNVLVFNFYGNTDTLSYVLQGFIFGTTVYWITHNPVGVTLTVNNNAGAVQLVFGSLTASVPVINATGMVRHM